MSEITELEIKEKFSHHNIAAIYFPERRKEKDCCLVRTMWPAGELFYFIQKNEGAIRIVEELFFINTTSYLNKKSFFEKLKVVYISSYGGRPALQIITDEFTLVRYTD